MSIPVEKYYPQLDSLRAIAVLLVMFSHFLAGGPWGDYGVRLFFVLSGFLITSIILSHKEKMSVTGASALLVAKNFYIRRSLRLFPIYYLALSIYLLLAFATGDETGGIAKDAAYHYLYLTNILVFVRGEWLGPLSPYWSLAVEEQFYIAWFWIVLLVPLLRSPLIILATLIGAPIFRLAMYLSGHNHYADVLLPACMDTLAAGALLAVFTHIGYTHHLDPLRRWLSAHQRPLELGVALSAMLLLMSSFGLDKENILRRLLTNTLSSIVFVYVVYRCYCGVDGKLGAILSNRVLIAIGKFSYGVYVYHMLVLYILHEKLGPWHLALNGMVGNGIAEKALNFLIPTLLTLGMAYLSWRYVERPFLRLKEKYAEGLGSI